MSSRSPYIGSMERPTFSRLGNFLLMVKLNLARIIETVQRQKSSLVLFNERTEAKNMFFLVLLSLVRRVLRSLQVQRRNLFLSNGPILTRIPGLQLFYHSCVSKKVSGVEMIPEQSTRKQSVLKYIGGSPFSLRRSRFPSPCPATCNTCTASVKTLAAWCTAPRCPSDPGVKTPTRRQHPT